MRIFVVLGSILLLPALSFGQGGRGVPGYCPYGCGPYIPMITTPSLSFTTVSPNPTGATNATGGLVAGATNSTLSEVSGNTDAVYTMPVWNSGGQTPLMSPRAPWSPELNVSTRERRMQRARESGEEMRGERRGEETQPQDWIYFSAAERTAGTGEAAAGSNARRTYSNEDVSRQNQQNGLVKHSGKTEKIQ